jgi:hypothetical protein
LLLSLMGVSIIPDVRTARKTPQHYSKIPQH